MHAPQELSNLGASEISLYFWSFSHSQIKKQNSCGKVSRFTKKKKQKDRLHRRCLFQFLSCDEREMKILESDKAASKVNSTLLTWNISSQLRQWIES